MIEWEFTCNKIRKIYSTPIKNSDLRLLIIKRRYDMNLGEKNLRIGDGRKHSMIVFSSCGVGIVVSVGCNARDPVFLKSYF
jgi:hypothetical protein